MPKRRSSRRSAVALAAQTDLLSQHADALLDLAHVLAAAGRSPEAQVSAATQALDLYQTKGNLPGAREALGYLDQHALTREEDSLMPNSQVPSIHLNQDGTISIQVNVYDFDAGTPVEISGQATQENGAVASFYSFQDSARAC